MEIVELDICCLFGFSILLYCCRIEIYFFLECFSLRLFAISAYRLLKMHFFLNFLLICL